MKYVSQGSLVLTNTMAISVAIDDDGETLRYKYSEDPNIKESKVEYDTTEGDIRPFFKTEEGVKYYLDEFMRVM